MARKKVIKKDSDSESDSEREVLQNSKVESKKKKKSIVKESSESEAEDDEMVCDVSPNQVKPEIHEGNFPLALKLKLLEELKTANKRKTCSFKISLRHLDWSLVKIDGYSTNELKQCLDEILKPICTLRTLDEMLNDYETHHHKYDLKMHPDAPKLPRNAVMRFIDQNREKLKKALAKEFPGQQIGLKEISSYGSKKFAELPEKEREKYKLQYKNDLKEYSEKKAEILKQCPELVKKRVPKAKEPKERAPRKERKKNELPYVTPFMIFREELGKEGKSVSFHDAQAMYKHMPDDEKMKYIQLLVQLDTNLEKQFSTSERKILKNSNGMPVKPLSAYNMFVKEHCKDETVDRKGLLKSSSNVWKTMSDEQKSIYEEKHQQEVQVWQERMVEWFKTLPIDQRAEQMAKHGFLSKLESKKKRRQTIDERALSTSTPAKQAKPMKQLELVAIKDEKNLKEKPLVQLNLPNKSPNTSVAETPKKKHKPDFDTSSIESSPKKKKFQERISSLGPYPSLTAAHYFMSQKYDGKPQKLAKAYNKLSMSEKKLMYQEVKKTKAAYFAKLKKYVEENAKDADKIRQFHENSRKEQEDSIAWHTNQGTDRSESDDSDDSGDSDSS